MSETDDTDVLLLIPPDFFIVRSSEDSSCAETARTVVPRASPARRSLAALHATIGSLEHRITSLELSVSPRTRNSSFTSERRTPSVDKLRGVDKRSYTFPRRRRRKVFNKKRSFDCSLMSARSSSYCEEISQLALSDRAVNFTGICSENKVHPFVMDSEISSVASSPSKKNDRLMLNEIDEFLNRVDTYESPETNLKTSDHPSVRRHTDECDALKYNDGNTLNHITLPSGRRVPQEFLDKYIYLVRNPPQDKNEKIPNKSNNQAKVDDNLTSVEQTPSAENQSYRKELKTSARKLNFNDSGHGSHSTPNVNRLIRVNTLPNMQVNPNSKALEKANKMLEQYNLASLSTCDTISNISSYASPVKDKFKFRKYSSDRETKHDRSGKFEVKFPQSVDTDLLSLSELWSERDGAKIDNAKLEEERLKREHCEAVIQDLQKKVLDQQENIAVAVRVDRAKDAAIARLRDAWVRASGNLDSVETKHKAALERMNAEMVKLRQSAEEAQKKTRHFESEMYKTLDLAHDYQDKCKSAQKEKQRVEAERERLLLEHSEQMKQKEEEMKDMKDNYESVMRLNKQLTDCVKSAEDNLEKERSSHNDTRAELSSVDKLTQEFREELTLLREERDSLKEKTREERGRCALLDKQLGEVQTRLLDSQNYEKAQEAELKSLRKQLEVQKEELKCHYQNQLEQAVLSKLSEFQQQLDAAEREMERDACEREGRAVEVWARKVARLEEQHKLEVAVLEEKHKEEMKLCRLQLAQATERIGQLESKLSTYRQRRGRLASQLHSVMERQWRAALDILTGPTDDDPSRRTPCPPDYPPVLPARAPSSEPADRLSLNLSTDRRRTDELSDNEIQRYVKMLLSKPPLDESYDRPVKCDTDDVPTNDTTHEDKHKKKHASKPPWKA